MCAWDKGITNGVAKTKTQKTDSRLTTWATSSGQNGNDRFKFLFCRWHCHILNQVHWRRPVFGWAPEVEIPVRGLKEKNIDQHFKASCQQHIGMAHRRFFCALGHKKRANIFHRFELENICRKFAHLETETILRAPPALRLFNDPGPKGQKCYKWLGWDKILKHHLEVASVAPFWLKWFKFFKCQGHVQLSVCCNALSCTGIFFTCPQTGYLDHV